MTSFIKKNQENILHLTQGEVKTKLRPKINYIYGISK